MSSPTTEEQKTTVEETAPADSQAPAEAPAADGAEAEEPHAAGEGAGEHPPETEASATEVDVLRAELEAAREEQQATNDRLLRTAAELQNVRRRAAEEQRRRAAATRAAVLRPMLDVLDDLQRALAAADATTGDATTGDDAQGAFQSLRSGVQMVNDKFESALAGLGVEPIEAEGRSFDETEHEAMMQQPAPEGTAPGTVLAEIRRGYRLEAGGEERVLRHSRVVVAAAPEKASTAEKTGEEESAEE